MTPQCALRRARRELRLVRGEDSRDGQQCWMVYRGGNGCGVYGDEAKGQDEYQKRLLFRALELIDPEQIRADVERIRSGGDIALMVGILTYLQVLHS